MTALEPPKAHARPGRKADPLIHLPHLPLPAPYPRSRGNVLIMVLRTRPICRRAGDLAEGRRSRSGR